MVAPVTAIAAYKQGGRVSTNTAILGLVIGAVALGSALLMSMLVMRPPAASPVHAQVMMNVAFAGIAGLGVVLRSYWALQPNAASEEFHKTKAGRGLMVLLGGMLLGVVGTLAVTVDMIMAPPLVVTAPMGLLIGVGMTWWGIRGLRRHAP